MTRTLALCLLLALPVSAEQLFFRNRPFKGPASGRGASLSVGLKEVAAAFDLPLAEKNGGYSVGTPAEPSAGQVLVNGTPVSATPDASGLQVNLKEFAAAGLTYKANRELDSIDVIGASRPGAAGTSGAAAGSVLVINQTTPGQMVDIKSLVSPGVTTFMLLYSDGYKDARYRSYFTLVDKAAALPNVAVVKVNVGPVGSPLHQHLDLPNSPTLMLFGPSRACWVINHGHSMENFVTHPELGVDDVRAKSGGNFAPFRIP